MKQGVGKRARNTHGEWGGWGRGCPGGGSRREVGKEGRQGLGVRTGLGPPLCVIKALSFHVWTLTDTLVGRVGRPGSSISSLSQLLSGSLLRLSHPKDSLSWWPKRLLPASSQPQARPRPRPHWTHSDTPLTCLCSSSTQKHNCTAGHHHTCCWEHTLHPAPHRLAPSGEL